MHYLNYSLHDIAQNFDGVDLERGRNYARDSRVISADMDGDVLEGEVRGSGNRIYFQSIDFTDHGDGVEINGECTCPVEYNCKHVVAVLLDFHDRHARAPVAQARPGHLPWAVASWLNKAQAVLAVPQGDVASPKAPSNALMFILCPDANRRRIELLVCKARLLENGAIGSATLIADVYTLTANPPAYLTPEDRFPIGLFIALRQGNMWGKTFIEPSAELGAQLLNHLLDERRLYWAGDRAAVKTGTLQLLERGPERSASLTWQDTGAKGAGARLAWQYDEGHPATGLIPTVPPLYVDNGQVGGLRLPANLASVQMSKLLDLVTEAPRLTDAEAALLSDALRMRGLERTLPIPASAIQTVRRGVTPHPCLLLGSIEANGTHHDFAVLTFDYDGHRAPADFALQLSGAANEVIERDPKAEAASHDTLAALGFYAHMAAPLRPLAGALALSDATAWLEFAQSQLATLRGTGWHIEMSPAYRYNVQEIEEWYADVAQDDGAGQAWFDLELGVVVNQERVSLLPILLQLIRSAPHFFAPEALAGYADSEPLLARLPSGASVVLPWSRVRPILDILGELYFMDHTGETLRLPSLDAARLAQLEAAAQMRWMGGERLLAAGRQLAQFSGIRSIDAPLGLQASLRPYQNEGLAWMQFLREFNLAGILADDMGLGKTLQTLAHILVEKNAGRLDAPALVVAPTSLMGNWQAEAARFTPSLRVLLLHGSERLDRFSEIDRYDVVLTTYALLPRDEAELCAHRYHLLVLDESQYIKNSRAKAAQTAAMLPARHRLCLTGTPLQNHLGELWAQFHFLLPGLLGDEKRFNAEFRKPIEKYGDSQRNAFLIRRIRPFLLRRTKDAVATELPAKTEIVREIELAGTQRDLYETVRLAMDKKVRAEIDKKGVARSQIVILDALLKLRQVCCDPRLVKLATERQSLAPSAKLCELMLMLEELLAEGRRILVFSQFTSMLALIEAELQKRAISYALLTGDTRDRTEQIETFQQGSVPLFLISLKAGGVGLNLTAADTVIHYDPWWNPAAENQATDRAWRIGQDKPVFVYKLIAKGTLEEKIQAMQRDKAALADAILDDGAAHKLAITAEDLQVIFAPLSELR